MLCKRCNSLTRAVLCSAFCACSMKRSLFFANRCFPQAGRLVQAGRCFPQNAAYDRQAVKLRGTERALAWYSAPLEWQSSSVAQQHGLKTWSEQCLKQFWKLAMHVANLPPNRWVKRVLLWNPDGARKRGYPRHDWTSKLMAYTRFKQLGDWQMLAQDRPFWMQLSDDFVKFCSTRWCFGLTLPPPQRGLPSDMQAQSQSQRFLLIVVA